MSGATVPLTITYREHTIPMHAQPAPFVTAPSTATREWLKQSSPMLRAQLSAAAMIATAARV